MRENLRPDWQPEDAGAEFACSVMPGVPLASGHSAAARGAAPAKARTALTAEAAAERNGSPTGEMLTLEAGDKLTLTGSDGVSQAWFETADGRFGILEAEKQDWQWFIGGVEENEVFSDIPYAG